MSSPADAVALYELAGAHDEAGREAEAIPLYREALVRGLVDPERSRAVVQLASSLRNVGELDEALALLDGDGDDAAALDPELAASVAAFRALVLHDLGRHGEALAVALATLAPTLPAYRVSVEVSAQALPASDARPGFANVGTLEAVPGGRDALVEILTRRNDTLRAVGCLAYEVGVDDSAPDTVVVAELWTNAEAHRASLALPSVRAAIAEAMPLLTGVMGGYRFSVVGSPLRDSN